MKRPLVLLAAGLALVLGACTAPAAEAPTPPAEVTPASTEAPAPAEPPIPDWMADQPPGGAAPPAPAVDRPRRSPTPP